MTLNLTLNREEAEAGDSQRIQKRVITISPLLGAYPMLRAQLQQLGQHRLLHRHRGK